MEDIGNTDPTPDHVATARELCNMHVRDHRVCWWCGYLWPCPTEMWATTVLRRASALSWR